MLSVHAKQAAEGIVRRLQLGSKLSDVVTSREDVLALFELYKNEGYILTEHEGRFCVSKSSVCLYVITLTLTFAELRPASLSSFGVLIFSLLRHHLFRLTCKFQLKLLFGLPSARGVNFLKTGE